MGFEYLGIVERIILKIHKYYSLLDKYYNGKILEDRARLSHNDLLSQCDGQAIVKLAGTNYCYGMSKKFNCSYQCEPNYSGIIPCSELYDDGIMYYEKIITNIMNLDEDGVSIAAMYSNKINKFYENLLGELEDRVRDFNESTIFKQRVYNLKKKKKKKFNGIYSIIDLF
jgi:hypothetical protein